MERSHDPVIEAGVGAIATCIAVVNMIVHVSYRLIDPRIRSSSV